MDKKDIRVNSAIIELMFVRCFTYLFVFIFFLWFYINSPDNADLRLHLRFIETFDQGRLVIPHFLYHLTVFGISKISHMSFLYSSCLVTAFCIMITMALVEMMLRYFLKGRYSDYFLLFVSLALMLVSAFYFPLVNKYPYLGIWSPNPWHNPTFIASRPLALLSFYWYAREVINGTGFKKRFSLLRISILLVLCTLVKPNFVLAFAPASIFFCLFYSDKKMRMLFKTGLLFLPVIGVLLFQYLFTYYYDMKGDSSIRFCFFDVWDFYAASVPLAILQSVAFPLTLLVIMFSQIRKDKMLLFSWGLFIVGLLIAGFLCETGAREYHGNFIWTYMYCLDILFIFSAIGLLRWASECFEHSMSCRIKRVLGISIFLLHLFCGIYYIGYLIAGHLY